LTRTIAFTLLASSLLISACASKPDRRPPPGSNAKSYQGMAAKPIGLLFTSMDQNGDSIVQAAEATAGITGEWTKLSARGDLGALNYAEWAAVSLGSEDALPSFISFDRDLNGRLSQTEFEDRLRTEFSDLDKNADSALQRSELIFTIAPPRQAQGGEQRQRGGRGGGGGEGRGRPPR